MNITIQGYYGHSNLGDDLLMLVVYRFLCNNTDLNIDINSENKLYIKKFIPEYIDNKNAKSDMNLDGGGGLFFSFKQGTILDFCINTFVKLFGPKILKNIFRLLGKFKNIGQLPSISLGIGVGPYCKSSRRYWQDALTLSEKRSIYVRDNESFELLKTMNINKKIYEISDLVFLNEYWLTENYSETFQKESISFILRDWSVSNNYFEEIITLAMELKKKGEIINFFSFNPHNDKETNKKIHNAGFKVIGWNNNEFTLDEYLLLLKSSKVVITERAHGAIISANLGVPCVIIPLENKLINVHKMLSSSSILLDKKFSISNLKTSLYDILHDLRSYEKYCKEDVLRNQSKIKLGLRNFKDEI